MLINMPGVFPSAEDESGLVREFGRGGAGLTGWWWRYGSAGAQRSDSACPYGAGIPA